MTLSHATATNWTVSVDFEQQTGVAQWRDDESTRATFTVTDSGLVLFRTEDKVPGAVIHATQLWINGLIGL